MFITGPHAKEGMRNAIVHSTQKLLTESLDKLNAIDHDDPVSVWNVLTKLNNEITSLCDSYEYACSVTYSESLTRVPY